MCQMRKQEIAQLDVDKQFFWPNNFPNKESNGWEGISVVPGSHLSVILVVINGFRQWGVRKGQNMAQNWPRLYVYIYKTFGFGAL